MPIIFSVTALILSIFAIFINQWITFLPQVDIAFQYYRRYYQRAIAVIALTSSIVAYLWHPTTFTLVTIAIVMCLMPLSGYFHARKALVALNNPRHVNTPDWNDDDEILGYCDYSGNACAWRLSSLIPHHIINDRLVDQAILVAW
jgi:hypothetical protein